MNMVDEGKTQVVIAEYFGVSNARISQKIKKDLPAHRAKFAINQSSNVETIDVIKQIYGINNKLSTILDSLFDYVNNSISSKNFNLSRT